MKDSDNIEDWYKGALDNYSVEPDNAVWQSLSDDLDASTPLTDETISEWYKKEVVKLEERPDYSVWEKLSIKLDTSSVWDKLVVSLNKYDQFIWWRNLTFKGTAIFLLLFGSFWAYDNYQYREDLISSSKSDTSLNPSLSLINETTISNKPKKIANSSTIATAIKNRQNSRLKNKSVKSAIFNSSNKVISNNVTTSNSILEAISKTKTTINNQSNNKNINNLRTSITDEIYYHQINANDLSSLKTENERTIFTNINYTNLAEIDISRLYASSDFLVKKDKNKIVFNSKRFSSYFLYGLYARRIYVGFNVGIKKQGMITNFRKNAELTNYRQTNFLDFGHTIGTTVGYIVSDNFNIESTININSTSGYKRAYYAEGISYIENLDLNYSSISILAKKMNNKSTFDNKLYSTNFIAGIYAGYLRSAVSTVNNNSQKLDSFKKPDFGLVLGVEQDRYISKSFVITPSVRYNQGVLNVANNNNPFNSSRNFSFEFNLGVKYIFLKKGR
ncbi:MAG: hypothetical protein CO118_06010 [Flavobacteriales bacterium CG_4_9_14_3_um_filter_32_8]|nr:MAG: hypothetical protein CO118_06010 [Flavobacteriales bacterium CG_4_9_14_3_um_filter_32_8]